MKIRLEHKWGTDEFDTDNFAIHDSGALALLDNDDKPWRVVSPKMWYDIEVIEW